MIECNFVPAGFPVTVVAFGAITAGMNIIESMAVITHHGCIFILLVSMAAVTGHIPVFPAQPEICIVMIEGLLLTPSFFTMTVGTFLAQVAFMDVIILVAIHTLPGRLPEFLSTLMTYCAGQACVPALQRIVRHFVIKGFHTEFRHFCIASLMVCVTAAAICIAGTAPAVKSFLQLYVISNLFVAVEAQIVLAFLAERSVAAPALFLVFGVPLYQLARHNQ
jgi:hypothetical protein